MPSSVKIKVNNNFIKEVIRSAEKGLYAAGKVLEAKMKQIVPVKTGALKKSIEITKESRNKIRVGSDLDYSMAVEFGSVKNGVKRPQPYARPALKESKSKMKQVFINYGN